MGKIRFFGNAKKNKNKKVWVMFKRTLGKKQADEPKAHSLKIEELKQQLKKELQYSSDLEFRELYIKDHAILICFMASMTDKNAVDDFILRPIIEKMKDGSDHIDPRAILPISQISTTNQLTEISSSLISGSVYIYNEGDSFGVIANTSKTVERSLEKAETESLVYGPKISFTESLAANMNILRNNIKDSQLCMDDLVIGTRGKAKAKIIYIKDIANEDNINSFKQRISDLEIDHVPDTTVLAQLIEDNSWTVFPQLLTTELPDRLSIALLKGRVGVMMDRSPAALYGPTTFFSFFESTEDVYMRWNMGFFLRVLRFTSIFLSVLLTPAYVAVLTYHYEVIPSPLLISLGESRSNVPFPPVFEALLLEFIIELLREAGARLPTKVGQTMGIVGGIVIGQAAVDAGFTSNILIIIIALSALGSFTAPSYMMGTAIRIIRFPIIIMAGFWGGIGIMIAFCYILIHLLKLSSLGRPYFAPVYPFRW
ncbi:MAG: spore germination protein, partial [Bacillota bacterium]|nr:spore germination protein [Bacillota bacterium]